MRNTFLPFSPPLIGEEEIAEVIDTLHSDWITTGPKVGRFEQEFAASIGAPAALALNSCTSALHVALAALGIGPGDAVITTPMTFCSSVHVIEQIGARPILVDVEPETLNIDPATIQEWVENSGRGGTTGRLKAILPVHLYGHPCDMDAILAIAQEHKLAVIEDAAHALPAKYKGRLIGSPAVTKMPCSPPPFPSPLRDCVISPFMVRQAHHERTSTHENPTTYPLGVPQLTCFSFYATKNMTTAEGGMLTGPPELLDEARLWSLHGMSHDAYNRYSAEGSWYYEVIRPGFKYNMTDIQAAIGLHQLRKLPQFQARRREIVQRYNKAFRPFEDLEIPTERSDVEHAWHLYVLRLNLEMLSIDRARFIEELRKRNIGASVHFIPIHLHPYYRDKYGYQPEDFPVAYREYRRILSLPLYPRMSDQDVQDVIDAVGEVVRRYRR